MSKTELVLALMANGEPTDIKKIAEAAGWDSYQAQRILWNMKKAGYISAVPMIYEITEKGRERLKPVERKDPRDRREYFREWRARAKAEIEADAQRSREPDDIVQTARRTQANSVFNLGARA